MFELFNSKEKGEHFVASKVRLDERQKLKVVQEKKSKKGCARS